MSLKVFAVVLIAFLATDIFGQSIPKPEEKNVNPIEWRTFQSAQLSNSPALTEWTLDIVYSRDFRKAFRCSFLTLNNLARAAEIINEGEKDAFQCLNSMLVMHYEQKAEAQNNFLSITGASDGAVLIRDLQ